MDDKNENKPKKVDKGFQEAQKKLLEEKNTLKAIIDALEYGLSIQDRQFNIIYQNKVIKDIFGGLGDKCYKVYEGKDEKCEGCPVEIAFKDGRSHNSERKVIMPTGEVAYWENTANPVKDQEGRIVACLEIIRDITEKKKTQEALRAMETRYKTLFEQSNDCVYLVNLEGAIIDVNQATLDLFGYTRDEFLSLNFMEFIDEDQLEKAVEMLSQILEEGHIAEPIEIKVKKKDGSTIWIESESTIIFKDGEPNLIMGISRDITERKRLEQEREETIDKLEKEIKDLENRLRPREENHVGEELSFDLDQRTGYIIEDHRTDRAFSMFSDMVHHGFQGLCITRGSPDRYRERFDLPKTPFIWLTTNISEKEACIPPSSISKLSAAIISFLNKTKKGMVLFTGLEYLITQNGFMAGINLLHLLHDKIMASDDILLISVNPEAFSKQEINILRSEFIMFEDDR